MTKTSKIAAIILLISLVLPTAIFAQNDSGQKDNSKKNYSLEKKELKKDYKEKVDELKTELKTKLKDLSNAKESSKSLTGKVVSVSGNTISFKNNSTTYSADASNAKILSKYGVKIQISDIKIGNSIQVTGKMNGTNISARLIRNLSLETQRATLGGKVTAISGAAFTMETFKKGAQIVTTNSSTVFMKNSKKGAQFSDIKVGSMVKVTGVWNKTANTVAAEKVNIIVKTVHISFKGTLKTISGNTLTVTRDNGTDYTVDISKAVLVSKYYGKTSIDQFKVGDKVQIKGKYVQGTTSVAAHLVKDLSVVKPMPSPTPSPTPTPGT